MFEELFRIVFDRRHVKDTRLWAILIIAASFYCYDHYRIQPRLDRQGLRIRQIIQVAKLRDKIDALEPEETPRGNHGH